MIRKITIAIILTLLSFTNLFSETVLINGLYYVLNESSHEAELPNWENGIHTGNSHFYNQTYYKSNLEGDITIPYEIEYNGKNYKVLFNDTELFLQCNKITSIFVDTENVPAKSFEGCSQLKSIVFGEHVKTVGSMSLGENRSVLESITFKGNQIESIPSDFISNLNSNSNFKELVFEQAPLPNVDPYFFSKFQSDKGVTFVVPEGAELPDSWKNATFPGNATVKDPNGNTVDPKTGIVTDENGEVVTPGGGGGGSGETDPDAGITPTPRDYIGNDRVIDTNPSTFPNVLEGTLEKGSVEYKRTFTNSTDWQATYLPFTMNYDDWKDQLRVSKLMNIHRYDGDGDGINESWILEIKEIKSGNTIANQPYVLRPKNEGDNQEITITTSNSIIYPRRTNKKLTCWSTEVEYTFEGVVENYNDWATARSDGSELFIVNSGELRKIPSGSTSKLRAFRWYMKMKSKDDFYQMADGGVSSIRNVRLKVIGEDLEDNTTDIVTTDTTTPTPVEYYNVNGTRLDSPTSGINIVKMNDGSIKKLFIKR